MAQFRITGKRSSIEHFLKELKAEQAIAGNPGVSIGGVMTFIDGTGRRKPLGIEPLVYFVVVYSAHLAAELTHDKIKEWLTERAKQSEPRIDIEDDHASNPAPSSSGDQTDH